MSALPRAGWSRRRWLAAGGAAVFEPFTPAAAAPELDPALVARTLARAREWPTLRALLVAHRGELRLAERLRGGALDEPTNVKSVAKMVMATLVGAAVPGTRGSSTGS